MSVGPFTNVRIYPKHGARMATITWSLAPGTPHGDVFVAFSFTGTPGTWEQRNGTSPVPSAVGLFQDEKFVLNQGSYEGYYRLMLVVTGQPDRMSEPFRVMADMTMREYGVVKGILHQEFTQMRVTNGFPVWHCIPRMHGTPALNIDPDTDKQGGGECAVTDPTKRAYGLLFQGGFYNPILTWMRVMANNRGLKDDPKSFSPEDMTKMSVRLMAFPRPARGHMIVNPATDMRYLIGDEIKTYDLRGIIPVAYEATIAHLAQSDVRYQFQLPNVDIRAYRRLANWNPTL